MQVYEINLNLQNPLVDLLWLVYHSANFSESQLTKY